MKRLFLLSLFVLFFPSLLPAQSERGVVVEAANSANTFVLLIGINQYPRDIPSLAYCVSDSIGLAEAMKKIGVPEEQIILMVDDAKDVSHRPSKANIERQIELITDLVTANDQLVVTFSGHGVQIEGEAYLCPNDTNLDRRDSLVSRKWVYDRLERSPARKKLFIMDACRNEIVMRGERSAAGIRSLDDPLGDMDSYGFATLASSSTGQRSYEDEALKHGVFSYFVIKGLGGEADADKDGRVTFDELYNYTLRNTRQHVLRTRQRAQVPMRGGEFTGDFVLVNVALPTVPPTPPVRRMTTLLDPLFEPFRGATLESVDSNASLQDIILVQSCSPGQISWEDARLNHGVFMYCIIEGLKGRAANRRGYITMGGLLAYAMTETSYYVEENIQREQNPWRAGEGYDFILAKANSTDVPTVKQITGNKYAVLVGVTEYQRMTNLRFTKNDAEALRDQLLAIGFAPDNIRTLTNGSGGVNEPTKQNIESAVSDILGRAREGDLVVISLSGHGTQPGRSGPLFCPPEADRGNLQETTVPINKIRDDMRKCNASFKLLIVDACRDDNPFGTTMHNGGERTIPVGHSVGNTDSLGFKGVMLESIDTNAPYPLSIRE